MGRRRSRTDPRACWRDRRGRSGGIAGGPIVQIGGLTGRGAVGRARAPLRRGRRLGVVEEGAVLVVGQKYDRILPERAAAHGPDHARDERLAALNVERRVLVVLRPWI